MSIEKIGIPVSNGEIKQAVSEGVEEYEKDKDERLIMSGDLEVNHKEFKTMGEEIEHYEGEFIAAEGMRPADLIEYEVKDGDNSKVLEVIVKSLIIEKPIRVTTPPKGGVMETTYSYSSGSTFNVQRDIRGNEYYYTKEDPMSLATVAQKVKDILQYQPDLGLGSKPWEKVISAVLQMNDLQKRLDSARKKKDMANPSDVPVGLLQSLKEDLS